MEMVYILFFIIIVWILAIIATRMARAVDHLDKMNDRLKKLELNGVKPPPVQKIDPGMQSFTLPKPVPVSAVTRKPEPPVELSPTAQYIRDIWGKTWRWIVYGKEALEPGDWKECLIAMTWFLRVAVLLIIVLLINFVRNRFDVPFVPPLTAAAWMWGDLFFEAGRHMAVTVTWIFLAAVFLWVRKFPLKVVFIPAAILILAKVVFLDWPDWGFSMRTFAYSGFTVEGVADWMTSVARLFDFGILIGFFALILCQSRKIDDEDPDMKGVTMASFIILLVLALVWLTAEVSTLLHVFRPTVRGVGVSLLWVMYGAFFVIIGILRNRDRYRYLGIAFYAVVTLKLIFLDDIWHSRDNLRIVFLAIHTIFYITVAALYIRDGILRKKNYVNTLTERIE